MNISSLHKQLYLWYEREHRVLPWRETTNPYHIWLSEIILQQTRVAQGMEYYLRFVERFPAVEDLASADEDSVLRLWQGLGYYSRARHLHEAARMIVQHGWSPFPTEWEDIRQLPGVGDYTAGAIASFAYNQPYPAMDGNVYRVLSRWMDDDTVFDTSAGKKHFHQLIQPLLDTHNARLFNSAIMEFGALYCTPTLRDAQTGEDLCLRCPLEAYCLAHLHGTASLLPTRKPRPKVRDRFFTYRFFLSSTDNTTLLHQRTDNDIWKHLYEFPLWEGDCCLEPSEITVGRILRQVDFTHILSHQRIHARFYLIATDVLPDMPKTICIPVHQLDDYALSRLTLRALHSFGVLTEQ